MSKLYYITSIFACMCFAGRGKTVTHKYFVSDNSIEERCINLATRTEGKESLIWNDPNPHGKTLNPWIVRLMEVEVDETNKSKTYKWMRNSMVAIEVNYKWPLRDINDAFIQRMLDQGTIDRRYFDLLTNLIQDISHQTVMYKIKQKMNKDETVLYGNSRNLYYCYEDIKDGTLDDCFAMLRRYDQHIIVQMVAKILDFKRTDHQDLANRKDYAPRMVSCIKALFERIEIYGQLTYADYKHDFSYSSVMTMPLSLLAFTIFENAKNKDKLVWTNIYRFFLEQELTETHVGWANIFMDDLLHRKIIFNFKDDKEKSNAILILFNMLAFMSQDDKKFKLQQITLGDDRDVAKNLYDNLFLRSPKENKSYYVDLHTKLESLYATANRDEKQWILNILGHLLNQLGDKLDNRSEFAALNRNMSNFLFQEDLCKMLQDCLNLENYPTLPLSKESGQIDEVLFRNLKEIYDETKDVDRKKRIGEDICNISDWLDEYNGLLYIPCSDFQVFSNTFRKAQTE